MKLIHIVGCQNSGKTKLIIELLKEFNARGLRVGTIKHTSHSYNLDKPGKDSFRHKAAGGNPAAIVTKDQMAVYLPREENENPLDKLAPLFKGADLIIIEGYVRGPWKKLEVWRKEINPEPRFAQRSDIEAIITDDHMETNLPLWPRKNISKLVGNILTLIEIN